MFVVSRFRVAAGASEEDFRERIEAAHALLAERPGYVDGQVGRNLDEPDLWVLVTRWENVGSYRRALSSYDVKVGAIPLLSDAVDESSAFEPVLPGVGLDRLDRRTTDAARSLG